MTCMCHDGFVEWDACWWGRCYCGAFERAESEAEAYDWLTRHIEDTERWSL